MIGYIKGKATVVSKEFCFIEAGGIGYRVFISEMSRQKFIRDACTASDLYGSKRRCYTFIWVPDTGRI